MLDPVDLVWLLLYQPGPWQAALAGVAEVAMAATTTSVAPMAPMTRRIVLLPSGRAPHNAVRRKLRYSDVFASTGLLDRLTARVPPNSAGREALASRGRTWIEHSLVTLTRQPAPAAEESATTGERSAGPAACAGAAGRLTKVNRPIWPERPAVGDSVLPCRLVPALLRPADARLKLRAWTAEVSVMRGFAGVILVRHQTSAG